MPARTTELGEPAIHCRDAKRELGGSLDQRRLDRCRSATDVRGQLGACLAHQPRFPGAPISLRQIN
jgi:hypothetical protein